VPNSAKTHIYSVLNALLLDFLPTIFHTASIWLTVALAVQRYVAVCRSVVQRGGTGSVGRRSNTLEMCKIVGGVFAAALLFHSSRFAENRYRKSGPDLGLVRPQATVIPTAPYPNYSIMLLKFY